MQTSYKHTTYIIEQNTSNAFKECKPHALQNPFPLSLSSSQSSIKNESTLRKAGGIALQDTGLVSESEQWNTSVAKDPDVLKTE